MVFSVKSLLATSVWIAGAVTNPVPQSNSGPKTGGSGPYSAQWTTDSSLPGHTIYAPVKAPDASIPVLVWGNGACSGDGTGYKGFLLEIASHGFLVVSSGSPGGGPGTTDQDMTDSITWAASSSASAYGKVDGTKVAAAGHSCGGLEAYVQGGQPSIKSLGIFNSGFVSPNSMTSITKPTFYFMGGTSDIAYNNGERDYTTLKGVPKWIGNINVGHGGTYGQPNGGAYAKGAIAWLQWTLQGNATGAAYFKTGLSADGWTGVQSAGLDQISVDDDQFRLC